jgi:hypothetical protein
MGSLDGATLRAVEALLAEVKLLRADVHDGFGILLAAQGVQMGLAADDPKAVSDAMTLMTQIARRSAP